MPEENARPRIVSPDTLRGTPQQRSPPGQVITKKWPVRVNPLTYEEVGARLGLSKQRVRQIEAGAIEKLRAGERDNVAPRSSVVLP